MKRQQLNCPKQIVGNAGLFYVCHRLSALGWNAMPTSRNARGVDVMCYSIDGKTKHLIQVKSFSKKANVPLPDEVKERAFQAGDGKFWMVSSRYATDDFREKWERISF